MLGWIFVAALGIVWAIFLFPFIRRRMQSPVTTVEEFEQKMDYLAETHTATRGRWVLTPKRDERFLGPSGRTRSRVRVRRRQVLVLLLEATGLALLIGLFPPFHRILVGAAVLAGVMVLYLLLLVRIRILEQHRARARLLRSRRSMAAYGYETYPAYAHARSGGSNGRMSNGRPAAGGSRAPSRDELDDWSPAYRRAATNANGHPAGAVAVRNGGANGRHNGGRRNGGATDVVRLDAYEDDWRTAVAAELAAHRNDPVLLVDEDVHIVVHRSDEIDVSELRAAGAR